MPRDKISDDLKNCPEEVIYFLKLISMTEGAQPCCKLGLSTLCFTRQLSRRDSCHFKPCKGNSNVYLCSLDKHTLQLLAILAASHFLSSWYVAQTYLKTYEIRYSYAKQKWVIQAYRWLLAEGIYTYLWALSVLPKLAILHLKGVHTGPRWCPWHGPLGIIQAYPKIWEGGKVYQLNGCFRNVKWFKRKSMNKNFLVVF